MASKPLPTIECIRVNFLRPRYQNLDEWAQVPGHVYIGGKLSHPLRGGKSAVSNKWENPFKSEFNKTIALEKYREYARSNLANSIQELDNTSSLGCWCFGEDLKTCHGNVLVELLRDWRNGTLKPTRTSYDTNQAGSSRQRPLIPPLAREPLDLNAMIEALPDPGTEQAPRSTRIDITKRIQSRQPTQIPEDLVENLRRTILTNEHDKYSPVDQERATLVREVFRLLSLVSNESLEVCVQILQDTIEPPE